MQRIPKSAIHSELPLFPVFFQLQQLTAVNVAYFFIFHNNFSEHFRVNGYGEALGAFLSDLRPSVDRRWLSNRRLGLTDELSFVAGVTYIDWHTHIHIFATRCITTWKGSFEF